MSIENPSYTHTNETVSDIEGGPVPSPKVPIDKIDHEPMPKSIDSVADCPCENEASEEIYLLIFPIKISGDPIAENNDQEDKKSEEVIMTLKKPKSDPGVFNISPIPIALDEDLSLDRTEGLQGPVFGELIDEEREREESPEPREWTN